MPASEEVHMSYTSEACNIQIADFGKSVMS